MRLIELYKYNPALSKPQEMKETFVAREELLDEILREIRGQIDAKANQNILIIGPRGIGKTNLLIMIQFGIEDSPELAERFEIVRFREEEYSVISLRDFFERTLELLLDKTGDKGIETAVVEIRTESDDHIAVEKAIQALKDYAVGTRRKLVLFIDNFDLLLGEQSNAEQSRLRDVLMNESFLMIIGTSPTYFNEISDYKKPLYNFFKTFDLEDLSLECMESLLRKRAEFDGNDRIVEKISRDKAKLKAIRHLTGGNPRLVLMLYQFLTQSDILEVKAAINALLDDLTPYYKHKMESLPSQLRKIVDVLARMNQAATPTDLAKAMRLPVNQVSSGLTRLRKEGFISLAKQMRRRATYYVLTERLFRIWHQMRYASANNRGMQFLLDFISIWYSRDEWKDEFHQIEKRIEKSLKDDDRLTTDHLLEHMGYLAESAPGRDLKSEGFDSLIESYIQTGNLDTAESELADRVRENSLTGDRTRLAHNYFNLGMVYAQRWLQGGQRDTIQKAFDFFGKSVEADSDYADAYLNWATYLSLLGEGKKDEILLQEACEKYQRAVEIKPENPWALNNWGTVLGKLARLKRDEALFQDAFDKYRRAVEIKPDFHQAFNQIGVIHALLGDMKSALIQFGKALATAREVHVPERELTNYYDNLHHAYDELCLSDIDRDDWSNLKSSFTNMMDLQETVPAEQGQERLLNVFYALLRKRRIKEFESLTNILLDRGMEKELGFLSPFSIIWDFWKHGNDQRIIDRLNPEVREVVEQILEDLGDNGVGM